MKKLLRLAIIAMRVCALGVSVRAAEPSSAPVLRIEAGMHTAMIFRVAADADGRIALTVVKQK